MLAYHFTLIHRGLVVHAHAEYRVALYLAHLGEYIWLILYILGLACLRVHGIDGLCINQHKSLSVFGRVVRNLARGAKSGF